MSLKHVYHGNLPGEGENTYCTNCGKLLIGRLGYGVRQHNTKDSKCRYCETEIKGARRKQVE